MPGLEEIGLRAILETEAWEAGSAVIVGSGQQISKTIDSTAASMGDATRSFAAADTSVQRTAVNLRELGEEAKKTLGELQPLGIGLAGLGAAGGALIGSSVMLAARVEELGIALQTVGRNAGYTEEEIADYEAGVRAAGITTASARQVLLQMAQAEIDFASATDLATVAQDAAIIAQLDSSDAFQRMITGIQTGQVEILRTMGLTVNFGQAYERMAESLGISTDALTEQQKVQARTNDVMRAGETIAGAYEAAMTTAGKNLRTVTGRLWEETRVAIGENYLPMMGKVVFAAKDLLTAFNALDPAQQKQIANWIGIGTVVTTATGGFILLAPRIITTIEALGTAARVARDAGVGLTLYAEGASVAEISTLGFGASLGAVLGPLAAIGVMAGAGYFAIKNLNVSTEEAAEMQERLADASAILNPELAYLQQNAEQTAGSTLEWSSAIEETRDKMDAATRATVPWRSAIEETRDRLDEMVRVTIDTALAQERLNIQLDAMKSAAGITDALDKYTESMAEVRDSIADVRAELERTPLAYYTEEEALSVDELTIAQYKAVQATDRLAAAQQALAENTDPERQLALQAAVAQANVALGNANEALQGTAGGWTSNADAVGELREKLDELIEKQREVKATFDESIQDIMLNIMMARLATDGWTEAEMELALRVQLDMGVITQASYDAAMGMNDAMSGFAHGAGIEDTEAAFANMYWQMTGNIPAGFQVMADTATGRMFLVKTALLDAGSGAATAAGQVQSLIDRINAVPTYTRITFEHVETWTANPSQIPGWQHGGPVRADYPYWVGEVEPEIFVPDRPGRIIPEHDLGAGGIGNTYITNEGDTYNLSLNTVAGEEAVELGFHVLRTMG